MNTRRTKFLVMLPQLLLCWATCCYQSMAQPFALFDEPYRPGFHFTPQKNWTNEPNGLFFANGLYHMFYQANPFNNQFGNQSWGHATSTDLVNWEHRPVAIPAENGIMTFSGSAVHDVNNTSGLGTGGNGPLVAAYTGFNPTTGIQDQRLAFSNDNGDTWTKFAGNPVLSGLPHPESVETRDPKVFWHAPTNSWKMVLTHGGQKKASIWSSPNLKSWIRTQDFFANDISGQVGGWEVPDLFELPVKDPNGTVVDNKWVLSITPSSGSPAGGNGVNYFVGEFDGFFFTNENPSGTPLWADYGRDFDGQQSWYDDPQGRVVWTSVMQSYGSNVPTTPFRGQMALPRELSLYDDGSSTTLVQQPIAELQQLRGDSTTLNNVTFSPGTDPLAGLGLEGDMLEIIATFDPMSATSLGFEVRKDGGSERTTIGYNRLAQQMFVDKRFSGDISFDANAGGFHQAPLQLENGLVKLHAFVDRSSVELFGNDGKSVMSELIFPDPNSTGISMFATGGTVELVSLEVYELNSIWDPGPAPKPGSNTIARWSMNASPQAVGVPWDGPVSIDSRTRGGEGAQLGTTNQFYEPDPSIENLWMTGATVMATSSDVPPVGMFTPGNDGGSSSYDAGAIAVTDDRALHAPAGVYGDEFAFTDGFSIEMFFKTDGDQSGSGLMELLLQGSNAFRYGLIVNEGGAGNVRFALNDKAGTIPVLDINSVSGLNYADGQWHYLLASYDPNVGALGEISMTIANEDGTAHTATVDLATSFSDFDGLPAGGDGDLLIGREDSSLAGGARTFLGLIDEVQLTAGILPDTLRLGALPGDNFQPADFDRDGDVDSDDLSIWEANFETSTDARLYEGDADFQGDVNGIDFLAWQQQFTGSLTSPLAAATTVPEPCSVLLLLQVASVGLLRRWRH